MQLEEEEKSQEEDIKKKHFTCIRGKTKMMRKYDVEWKDTYIYILTTTLNYLLFNLFILLIKNHNDNQTCYVHMRL